MDKKDTFCILPWMQIATTAGGTYRVCCNSIPEKNHIVDDNGDRLTLSKHIVKNMWNTQYMKSLRKEMMSGIEPKICKRCFQEEKIGIQSARLGYNRQFKHLKKPLLENTLPNGFIEPYIEYMDLRLGNLCNLKCVMCNPYASNQWIDEWNLINEKLSSKTTKYLSHMDWFENDAFVEHLTPYLNTTKLIYLTGGEPTLAKGQYSLLDKCIDLNIAENITLKYNTNLTNIPSKLLEYWKNFKKIQLNVSIDAYGELNDYIRFPSKWKIIDRNLKQIESIAQDKNWTISIHCTVQMYNILHLTTLFDYLKNFKHIQQFPYLNILNHPEYLNVKVLPLHLKNKARDILMGWQKRNQDYYNNETDREFLLKIDGLLQYMYNDDWSYLFEEFKTKTIKLDESRNLNIVSVASEFKDYFND